MTVHATSVDLEDGIDDRVEEPAVVGHQHEGEFRGQEPRLQPLDRIQVEMVGRLVEEDEVGLGREGARQRGFFDLAAGHGGHEPVEIGEPEFGAERGVAILEGDGTEGFELPLYAGKLHAFGGDPPLVKLNFRGIAPVEKFSDCRFGAKDGHLLKRGNREASSSR